MRFRTATSADADAVRALTMAAYARWVPVLGRRPRPMTADYAVAVVAHRIDLIESAGSAASGGVPAEAIELAGLIEMVPEPGVLLIENVAVAPDRQGQGLGRALLAHAEEVAGELGLHRLRLYTNALFATNIRLYERLGYQVDREETYPGGSIVHMSKDRA